MLFPYMGLRLGRYQQTFHRNGKPERRNSMDILKDIVSVLATLVPLAADKRFNLLPVNPSVRNEVFLISVIAALVASAGGYRVAKLRGLSWPGWSTLTVTKHWILFAELILTSARVVVNTSCVSIV